MSEYSVHRPSFSSTSRDEWRFPTQMDFDTDDLSAVAEHFLLSSSGFDDPEAFEDLALPVVTPQGMLNLNALWAARHGPYSVERIADINDETEAAVEELIEDIGTENFEEFEDVTITRSEWEAATGGGPANPAGGIVGRVVDAAQPSHSPERAAIGLVFLVGTAAIVARFHEDRS